MIRQLRRRHRLAWSLAALLAPATLGAGLAVRAARPPETAPPLAPALIAGLGAVPALGATPHVDRSPGVGAALDFSAPGLGEAVEFGEAPGFPGLPLLVRVLPAPAGGARALELQAREPLLVPDVLVYVHAAPGAAGVHGDAALPPGARLLGAMTGTLARRWPLPDDATELLLYSLAHDEILARGPLPPAPPHAARAPR